MEEPLVQNPVAIFLTIIAVILVAPLIIERFRLPGIVGIIVGGIIIGPYALNLLSVDATIETLAVAGLVYLMFSVGLEIDLRQFKQVRNKAIVFGLLTFSLPMINGIVLGRWLGYSWESSFLLGAVIASHALINYPILSRLGIIRNEAVAATLGATVFCDISALLVLAFVVRNSEGSGSALDIVLLIVSMVAYTTIILFVVPRLGKLFFRRFKSRAVEFQFILVVLFTAALVAELIDMHVIIGAFLAGLAINSTLPSRSPVLNRVLFLGEAFFIPIFLLYIGMIIDPAAFFSESNTLIAGWMMIASVYLTKLVAAWIDAGIYHYSRDELFTIWGITQAQATTTLAVLLVGVEAGLLPEAVFNGGVMMVMVTCITSSIMVQHFGSRLQPSAVREEEGSFYDRILVSLSNPGTQEHLIGLAGLLARAAGGKLFPLHVILRRENERYSGGAEEEILLDSEDLNEPETEVSPIHRVDTSVANGILHAAMENSATMIVMGWHGQKSVRESAFGSVVDQVLWNAEMPVLVGHMKTPINAMNRMVLVLPAGCLFIASLEEILETVSTMAEAVNVSMLVLSDESYVERMQEKLEELEAGPNHKVFKLGSNVVRDVVSRTGPQDLIIIPTVSSRMRFGSCMGRMPEQLAEDTRASLAVMVFPA
ncbi:MAG: cation:proton antiporter [Actinobacteria bacterium]|nr:cation:proton antiporter [Actinomycetota bacterium]